MVSGVVIGWQRSYRLALVHVRLRGELPVAGRKLVVQGEDLGAWVVGQRTGWERLMPAHWFLLESIGVEAPAEDEAVRRTRGERWAVNVAAARQFHAWVGHLRVPRKAVEVVAGEQIKLGAFLDNARRRASKLSERRRAEFDELGMRWS
ncbi:helicase associated domain-containing protein [Streptomyces sp. NPDC051362]|uniref:helicase associated domain-containing protein n=1 Tax=Streptomyces sp. NPDC051362 TaxID=3365651 RepID=UPI0037A0111D